MLDYHRLGDVPAKHHIALPRKGVMPVHYEHCLTRRGFDGGYSIAYRTNNPGAETSFTEVEMPCLWEPVSSIGSNMRRHHIPTPGMAAHGTLWESLRWLCGNEDIRIGTAQPTVHDSGLVQNGDGDVLLFIHKGAGFVDSELGHVVFGHQDYVWLPRGLIHRVHFEGEAHVMVMECRSGLEIPSNFRNPWGQLKMDAPYCHRDFRKPQRLSEPLAGDMEEDGVRLLHKRGDVWTKRVLPHHPFDVVGFDGTVYPVALNIKDYQPKTGLVHLPPTIHTTFLAGNGSFVVCSFVPRKVDYHPDAIPCPYPHSSVDCDEVLWYVEGNFTSRKGVGPASMSLHPAGIPHAPQPGKYEASMGEERTDEMAVMVDTFAPLQLTKHALAAEDPSYHGSWTDGPQGGTYVD